MEQQSKKYYLESLRGIAALSVAIHHFDIGSIFNNGFTEQAWILVDLFFVLSGYLIALNYLSKIQTTSDLYIFQKRRFWRLYPLHVTMLFVFLGIEVAKYIFETYTHIKPSEPAFSINNLSTFIQNLLFLQNTINLEFAWNFPSWTIAAEFYTYFLFASLVLMLGEHKRARHVVFILVVIAAAITLHLRGLLAGDAGIYRCLLSFFLGCLLFEFEQYFKLKRSNFGSAPAACLLFAGILFVIYAAPLGSPLFFIFPLLCAALIFTLNHTLPDAIILKALEHRWLVYLGTVSYGVYMIHIALWWVFKQALRFVVETPTYVDESGRTYLAMDNLIFATATHIVGLAILFMLAHTSFKWLEQPLTKKFY